MTLTETKNLAKSIFRLLKVTEISFPIGRTNKGNLEIKFSQNNEDFDLLLDSVPLPTLSKINDENNITLKALVEKYWFYTEQAVVIGEHWGSVVTKAATKSIVDDELQRLVKKNKGGRPVGSKNKPKPVEDKVNG